MPHSFSFTFFFCCHCTITTYFFSLSAISSRRVWLHFRQIDSFNNGDKTEVEKNAETPLCLERSRCTVHFRLGKRNIFITSKKTYKSVLPLKFFNFQKRLETRKWTWRLECVGYLKKLSSKLKRYFLIVNVRTLELRPRWLWHFSRSLQNVWPDNENESCKAFLIMSRGEIDFSEGIKKNIVSSHVFFRDIKNEFDV